jgi:endogenous inhibitor of DNA gyrase (YacG/DUF329 family)
MKCPQCGKAIADPAAPFRPFCSERCKLVDLGRWISEDYKIPTSDTDGNDDENPEKNPPPNPMDTKEPVEE